MVINDALIGGIVGLILGVPFTILFFYLPFIAKRPKIVVMGSNTGGTAGLNFSNDPSSFGMKLERDSCTINTAILIDTLTKERYAMRNCWSDCYGKSNLDLITIRAGEQVGLELFEVNDDGLSYSVIDRNSRPKRLKPFSQNKTTFQLKTTDTLGRIYTYNFLVSFNGGHVTPCLEFSLKNRVASFMGGLKMIQEAFQLKKFQD